MVKKKDHEEQRQEVAEEVARGGSSEGVIQSGKIQKSENLEEAKFMPMQRRCETMEKHALQVRFELIMMSMDKVCTLTK